jgi:aminopeptidase N
LRHPAYTCSHKREFLPVRQTLLLASSLLGLAAAAHAEAPFNFDTTPGKLPKNVVPQAYRIDITPDLQKLTLSGQEAIDITVRSPVTSITLNQAGLALQSARLEDGSTAAITLDQKAQTATLRFPHTVTAGQHTLDITYTGPIPATPNGIYYDDYKTASGAAKRMLVTQFEVADARRMFPGWDEPAFKATFQLSVTLPKDLAVVSNMPAARILPVSGGRQHIAFETTPRMSTYLLALLAGDMEARRSRAGHTALAAWTPAGEADQGTYALDVETKVLPYYNSYFGVAYPLPKLDLIAVPGNYAAGAMENWGAITFVDSVMLFDPATSAPSTREDIHLVVAHEMAHQWSGDLVTMGWWDNIWLNEGFATWMELKATDHFNPSWQVWPRQHQQREEAMAQDAAPTTHPIQQVIHDETEADSAFDGISYQKGEQIIRMIEDWIGPDVFRDGMRRYMKAHQFGNTTSADLWAALGAAAHRDVAHVAAGFTEQPGVPLVHVARSCTGGHAEVTLTQDRFTIHDPHPKQLRWTIPVTLGAPGTPTQHVLLDSAPAILPLASCDTPIKANLGEDGYYRTQYDAASLQALQPVLSKMADADRANLLGDQYALFEAGSASLADYLGLVSSLHDEQSVAVWTDTLGNLRRIDRALAGTEERVSFDRFAAGLIRPELARLGWDARPGELFLDSILRPQLIAALGRFQDPATLAEAKRRFAAFLKQPASLAPGLREPVLDIVGHSADQATYDTLKALGIKAPGTEEKMRYFEAMAGAADPKLMQQTVAFAGSGEVPNGRIPRFLFRASGATGNADLLFQLVQPHEAELAAHLPPGSPGPSVLAAAAAASSNPAIAAALLAAPSSNASTGAHVWAARIADAIGTAAELRRRIVPQVQAALSRHAG